MVCPTSPYHELLILNLEVSSLGELANEILQAGIRRISTGPAVSPQRTIHRQWRRRGRTAGHFPHLSRRRRNSIARHSHFPARRSRRRTSLVGGDRRRRVPAPHAF